MNLSLKYLLPVLIASFILPACGRKGPLIIPGTVLPRAPSGVSAASMGTGVILSWTMPGKNTAGRVLTDLAGFKVMRAEIPAGQEVCPCQFRAAAYVDLEMPDGAVITGKNVAWLDRASGLEMGKRYAYQVSGVNRGGFAGPPSATVIVRPLTPPAAPEGLTAAPGDRLVTLGWEAVEKDAKGAKIGDLAGYNVYRGLETVNSTYGSKGRVSLSRAVLVNEKPVKGTKYEDMGLINSKVYYYRVSALRGSEPPYIEGGASIAPVEAVPAAPPPAAPTGLQAVPGEGIVLLSWLPSAEGGIAGYYVYRKGPGETGYKRLNDRPTDRITYKDADVLPGSEYTYAVTAVDSAVPPHESGRSEGVPVKLP